MSDLLQELRHATSELHRQLDGLIPAAAPADSVAAYTDYLSRFYGALRDCWPTLDWKRLAEMNLPNLELRRSRYLSLADDLLSLGERPDPLPSAYKTTDAEIIGCLYVLEGSIHGGRFLFSQLEARGTLIPLECATFLNGFGEENPAMWAGFVRWLQSVETSPDFRSQACETAARTFKQFIAHFEHFPWSTPNPRRA